MVRIGLIGCGFIGRVHSLTLGALPDAGVTDGRITAVSDGTSEKAQEFADAHGATVFSDTSALIESVDAVYVCTPTATHRAIVEASAELGVAVFCEKPLAENLEEAERVAGDLARVPHQTGLVLRFAPVFRRMQELLGSGRYGRPMHVFLRDDQYFPVQGRYASSWRSDASIAGGGTLIEHSIHDLDLFRWFLGDPSEVSCRTASFFEYPGIEDVATVTLTYPDGATAVLVSVWHQILSRASRRRVEVFCERGLLWTDDDNFGPLHIETGDDHEVAECEPPAWTRALDVPEEYRRVLAKYSDADRAFIDRLAGTGDEPGPTAEDALAAHRVVEAAYRSAREGGAVTRP